jgi:3'-phosphoadenosine 5'-phosphosulfate sulfotransferase (PAPS reductase)/FAD synthetase
MRHIIPISGKDSLATALVQRQLQPDLDYEYMFNPTGAELPEVFDWLKKVEEFLGREIVQVGESLKDIIEDNNFFLPSRRSRYCTRQSKIEPMEKWIGKDECIIYYGIRADEKRTGYINNRFPNIIPKMPLIDEGIDINGVYSIINSHGLKPPTFFWQSLYELVKKKFGVVAWEGWLLEWQFDLLFCWRTRANCFFCFNQRKFEWGGLYEHHPDLFWEAEKYEHQVSEYFWRGQNKPLTDIPKQIEKIKRKRASQIVKLIWKIYNSKNSMFPTEELLADELNLKTCGLFCGK